MSIQIENPHPGEWLIAEIFNLSRDAATLIAGQNLLDGAVLGKITASGKYTQFDPAAGDGSQVAAAILFGDKDASAADQAVTVVPRLAAVMKTLLVWKSGLTNNQKLVALSQLATLNIIARDQR